MRLGPDFTTLIDRFNPAPSVPIAVAVSGGGDSIALLHLCHQWATQTGRKLMAFTVNHGLREAARIEAEGVAQICAGLDVAHEILTWDTPKPTQNAARSARYGLIATAMKRAGAVCLVTGHSFDDVIETALIRRRRGVRGALAAGPAPAAPFPIWPAGRDLVLLRPLIRTRRAALRAFLSKLGAAWVEDPSNQDTHFERVRIRQFLARHHGLSQIAARAAARLQVARVAEDTALAAALSQIQVDPDGLIRTFGAANSARVLTLAARAASGGARDPRRRAVTALIETLTTPGTRQTLGGAWIQRTDMGFLIGRDPAQSAETREGDVFDGRFVPDPDGRLPAVNEAAFLVRHALPPDPAWRQIISSRFVHMQACLRAPLLQSLSD